MTPDPSLVVDEPPVPESMDPVPAWNDPEHHDNGSFTMLLVSRSPYPFPTCRAKAAVAAAPMGVAAPAVSAAACDKRRSLSMSFAMNPGLKPFVEAAVGTGPGNGQESLRMVERAVDVDSTS